MAIRLGILEMIGLATTLVLAIPISLVGLEFLLGDRPISGLGLLLLAAALVVASRRLTTPQDLPAKAVEWVAGAIAKEPEEDRE